MLGPALPRHPSRESQTCHGDCTPESTGRQACCWRLCGTPSSLQGSRGAGAAPGKWVTCSQPL